MSYLIPSGVDEKSNILSFLHGLRDTQVALI
jgi:hypothetical protein